MRLPPISTEIFYNTKTRSVIRSKWAKLLEVDYDLPMLQTKEKYNLLAIPIQERKITCMLPNQDLRDPKSYDSEWLDLLKKEADRKLHRKDDPFIPQSTPFKANRPLPPARREPVNFCEGEDSLIR